MKVTKKLRRLTAILMAAVVIMSGFLMPATVRAAGEGRSLGALTFSVKDEQGNPMKGIELDVFGKNGSSLDQNIESNDSGEATWSPEDWFNNYYAQQDLTIAPAKNGNYASDNPIHIVVGTGGIVTVNGTPAEQATDVTLTVREKGEEDNTTTLYLYVKDEEGNPLEGIVFLCDQAWGDPKEQVTDAQGLLKYVMPQYVYSEVAIKMKNSAVYESMESVVLESDGNGNITSVNGEAVTSGNDLKLEITLVAKGEGPVEPDVNIEELENVIERAKAIENENYTDESWNALQQAIEAAEALLEDSKITQEKVTEAIRVLEEAIEELKMDSPEVDMLTFTLVVKDESGEPVEGVQYLGDTNWVEEDYLLESNAEGKIVKKFYGYETITFKLADDRYTTTAGNIYVRTNGTQITEVNGQPVESADDLVFEVVVKKNVASVIDRVSVSKETLESDGGKVEFDIYGKELEGKVEVEVSKDGAVATDVTVVNMEETTNWLNYWITLPENKSENDVEYTFTATVDGKEETKKEAKVVVKGSEPTEPEFDNTTFTVKVTDENGQPVEGLKLYMKSENGSWGDINLTNLTDAEGKANYIGNKYEYGTYELLPVGDSEYICADPIEIVYAQDDNYDAYIDTVNGEKYTGQELNLVVKKAGDRKTLTVSVVDGEGNPVDDCEFVVADEAFPNVENASALVKPENGVLKIQLNNTAQLGGEIRLSSEAKESYTSEPEKIVFQSSKGVFTTVDGQVYDGTTTFKMVVTKIGGEPEEPEVNTSELEKAIAETKAIKNENYTEASWSALQEAIEAAEAILKKEELTQDEVFAQIKTLKEAVDGLEKEPEKPEPEEPEVNTSELEKAIAEAKAIKNENYTEASWSALQEAIEVAEAILEKEELTQDEVSAQMKALKTAVDGLTKKDSDIPKPGDTDKEDPDNDKPGTDKPNAEKPNSDVPKTGDTAPVIPYAAGMIFAVVVVFGILRRKNVLK